jgi:hypothetical protein
VRVEKQGTEGRKRVRDEKRLRSEPVPFSFSSPPHFVSSFSSSIYFFLPERESLMSQIFKVQSPDTEANTSPLVGDQTLL